DHPLVVQLPGQDAGHRVALPGRARPLHRPSGAGAGRSGRRGGRGRRLRRRRRAGVRLAAHRRRRSTNRSHPGRFACHAGAVRADRLVATLLILQARGRVTAAELAEELEVSERTARRDLEALAMAGIPVYSQPGRNGGWSLLGGARTDLSGLTAAEARALFLLAGPSSRVTPEAKAALRKLVQALPETFRAEAEAAASAVVLDPAQWGATPAPPPPFLDELQRAVVAGRQVELGYADREGRESVRTVHPLGLVSKTSVWYLVAGTDAGLRTFRVSRVRSVTVTDRPVERPEDFDLEEA